MRINDNGVYRDMTPEEVKRYEEEIAKLPPPQPSPEQRITELEAKLAALTAGYAEGVQNA